MAKWFQMGLWENGLLLTVKDNHIIEEHVHGSERLATDAAERGEEPPGSSSSAGDTDPPSSPWLAA